MLMIRASRGQTALALLGLLAFAGCGGSTARNPITVDGSSTVFPISRAAQEGFNAEDPSVEVIVNRSGTGGGFGNYLRGEVDIVDASRPAKKEEEAQAKEKGL